MSYSDDENFMENFWSNYPKFLPPDLGRIRVVLDRLGNPHLSLPCVIHVAGTNGKGSVVENLHAILTEAGHSCHIYSSPHLVCINERIKVAGFEISDQKLRALKKQVDEAASDILLTWFDVLTCIAFLAFSEIPADYTLLETGLGGRFDATNVVAPFLTLITSISKDHQAQLGDTIEKITFEKAGIIKENVPVIVGCNDIEIQEYIQNYHDRSFPGLVPGPRLAQANQGKKRTGPRNKSGEQKACFAAQNSEPIFCGPPTTDFRKDNQDLARAAAQHLKIPDDMIEQGLLKAALPGRFQKLAENIYVDGAHNEGGALALSHLISDMDKPVILVIAMNARKCIRGFLKAFQGKVDRLITPKMTSDEFYKAEDITAVAEQMGFEVEIGASLEKLYRQVQSDQARPYVFTGSLHFVGEVLSLRGT